MCLKEPSRRDRCSLGARGAAAAGTAAAAYVVVGAAGAGSRDRQQQERQQEQAAAGTGSSRNRQQRDQASVGTAAGTAAAAETWESNGTTRHRQTVCARQQTTRNEQHGTAEGPRGAARRRARRGGEQWRHANHSRCRDAEEEQTMSSQTEDSRVTRTSNTLYNMEPRGSGPGSKPRPRPAPSSVSLKSDWSRDIGPEFREDGPEDQRLYNMEPRGSGPGSKPRPRPAPSSVSLKSDRSKGLPPEFREDGPEDQRLYNMEPRGSGPWSKPRPGPAPSSVSLKSDRSKGLPPEFREDGPEDQRDPGPKEPLDAILRRLQEDVVTFVKEQLQRIQRLLASDYPECSESEVQSREVLNIALDFLRRMKQEQLVQRLQSRSSVGVCRDEQKKQLQQRFSRVFEGVAKAGDSAPLTQIYTELYITEGGASEVNQEHETFYSSGHNLLKTPQSSENLLKTPQSSENLLKTPQSSENLLKTPQSSENLLKTPQSSENLLKTPQSPENLLKTPQSSENLLKTPQSSENLLKTPQSSENLLKTPQSSENLLKKPQSSENLLKTPQSSENLLKTPQSSENLLKTPQSSENLLKTPQSSENLLKTPQSSENLLKTPQSSENLLEALQSPNGHLDLFLRFLLGLSLPTNQRLLSDSDLQDFDLRKYQASERALLGLLPVVRASTKALLRDSGLSPHSCGPLASVLSSSSLTHLDLSNNDLQDSGVELLCSGLKSAPCGLHTLRLSGCLISERGGAALASALSPAPSHLRELDLSYNHPGGSSELLKALQDDPHCPLQELRLDPAGEQWMVPGLRKYSCRVSVFLDSEAGSLSFYQVRSDGELFHLHTVTSSFSEPVFPGFGLGSEGSSVSVVDLRRAPPAGPQ
uniref:FISNA domain-containing protein n=1 Tax=Knipowitschia caucasica TaxID=637954 RepID=A0AAV2JF81_KNICA